MSHGRYVRLPPGSQTLRVPHYFGSRDWTSDDELPDPRWGEWDGARTYYNGEAPDEPLRPAIAGASDCIENLSSGSADPATTFYAGFPSRCYENVDDCASESARLDVTVNTTWKNCAAIICRLYTAPATAAAAAFEWFPEIQDIYLDIPTFFDFAPPSITFRTPCNCVSIVAGTTNEIQLGVQALYSGFPNTSIGPFKTQPLWWNLAKRISLNVQRVGGASLPLFLSGHSFGGASCAVLAAVMKWSSILKQVRCVCFGMPRPGDADILPYLQFVAATYLCTPLDPVPQLPPNPLIDFGLSGILGLPLFGQWQAIASPLRAFTLQADGSALQETSPTLGDVLIQQAADTIATGNPFPSYSQHLIKTYLDFLWAFEAPLQTCRSIVPVPFVLPAPDRCC